MTTHGRLWLPAVFAVLFAPCIAAGDAIQPLVLSD